MKRCVGLLLSLFLILSVSAQDFEVGSKVQARWGGYWHKGTIVEIKKDKYLIHYDGYGVGYDQWLTKEQFRIDDKSARTKKTSPPPPAPPAQTKQDDPIVVTNVSNPPQSSVEKTTAGKSTEIQKVNSSPNNPGEVANAAIKESPNTAVPNTTAATKNSTGKTTTSKSPDSPAATESNSSRASGAGTAASNNSESKSPFKNLFKKKKDNTPEVSKPVEPSGTATVKITTIEEPPKEKTASTASSGTNGTYSSPGPAPKTSSPSIKPTMIGDKAYIRNAGANSFAFYLTKDNLIVRNPKHGINPLNTSLEKQTNPENVGTYIIEGEKMKVAWSDGSVSDWKVAYSTIVIYGLDGGVVSVLKPMPVGYILNSTYKARGFNGKNTDVNFKADGSFVDETGLKGKYSIVGNTLTLVFENKQTVRSVISVNTIGAKRFLVIDNASYPLQ